MEHPTAGMRGRTLETDRLLLRPWRVSEAAVQREMWTERDPRVPPHRRIDADGRPTVEDVEDWIRSSSEPSGRRRGAELVLSQLDPPDSFRTPTPSWR